jgi:glycosyltransferase involved in cell wall biosynthesis
MVSVVIPCYNQAHFLGEAIESALSQSYPLFEIIVVDDGSPDNTAEVAARYPEVRYVRQDNQGVSVARNSGLARSGGAYIVFLDADDRLLPGALEVGVKELEAHPECALVSGRYRIVAGDGSFLTQPSQHTVDEDRYVALLQGYGLGPPAVVMYRREVLESVGGFDGSVDAAADYDLYLRIARRFRICSHEKEVAERRQHDMNMTHNSGIMLSHAVATLRSQRKHMKGNNRYEEAYKVGVRSFQEHNGIQLVNEV